MAQKEKKVTATDLKKIIGKYASGSNENVITFTDTDFEVSIKVKTFLTAQEIINFVNDVVNGVVQSESGVVIYEMKEFFIKTHTISHYTNITLPKELDQKWRLCMQTPLYDEILNAKFFNRRQYEIILEAIDEQIEFNAQKILNKTKIDELLDIIIAIIQKIDSSIDFKSLGNILNKLVEMENIDEKEIFKVIVGMIANNKK